MARVSSAEYRQRLMASLPDAPNMVMYNALVETLEKEGNTQALQQVMYLYGTKQIKLSVRRPNDAERPALYIGRAE